MRKNSFCFDFAPMRVWLRPQVYPYELEAVPEYEGFKEWLQSYELYRGKKTDDEPEDDNRVVGVFKV